MIVNPVIYSGKKLPELDNPGDAADLLAGKQLVDQYGNLLTGSMPQRSAGDLTASGRSVIVPSGYYPEQANKDVAAASQATPAISVSSAGLITASAVQEEGYVAAGTKSATKQLTTQAAATITPGTSAKTAVAAGRYTTGAVTVAGSANLTAGNIRSGVSIFGVTGSYKGEAIKYVSLGNVMVTTTSTTSANINLNTSIPSNARVICLWLLISPNSSICFYSSAGTIYFSTERVFDYYGSNSYGAYIRDAGFAITRADITSFSRNGNIFTISIPSGSTFKSGASESLSGSIAYM